MSPARRLGVCDVAVGPVFTRSTDCVVGACCCGQQTKSETTAGLSGCKLLNGNSLRVTYLDVWPLHPNGSCWPAGIGHNSRLRSRSRSHTHTPCPPYSCTSFLSSGAHLRKRNVLVRWRLKLRVFSFRAGRSVREVQHVLLRISGNVLYFVCFVFLDESVWLLLAVWLKHQNFQSSKEEENYSVECARVIPRGGFKALRHGATMQKVAFFMHSLCVSSQQPPTFLSIKRKVLWKGTQTLYVSALDALSSR